jgi:hypothetical protein
MSFETDSEPTPSTKSNGFARAVLKIQSRAKI